MPTPTAESIAAFLPRITTAIENLTQGRVTYAPGEEAPVDMLKAAGELLLDLLLREEEQAAQQALLQRELAAAHRREEARSVATAYVTMRDRVALAYLEGAGGRGDASELARRAYAFADAFIEARP